VTLRRRPSSSPRRGSWRWPSSSWGFPSGVRGRAPCRGGAGPVLRGAGRPRRASSPLTLPEPPIPPGSRRSWAHSWGSGSPWWPPTVGSSGTRACPAATSGTWSPTPTAPRSVPPSRGAPSSWSGEAPPRGFPSSTWPAPSPSPAEPRRSSGSRPPSGRFAGPWTGRRGSSWPSASGWRPSSSWSPWSWAPTSVRGASAPRGRRRDGLGRGSGRPPPRGAGPRAGRLGARPSSGWPTRSGDRTRELTRERDELSPSWMPSPKGSWPSPRMPGSSA
jgi:hypothetical protein